MSALGPDPVFVITHEFFPKRGGIATVAEEIARAAVARGHPVEVWAQRAGPEKEKPWPFTVRRLPLAGTHNFFCRLKIISWMIRERRRLRHAIVYLPEPGPMLALMMLLPVRSFLPQRLVLTFHGSEVLRFHADPVTRWFTHRLIRHAFRISTLTHYTRRILCDRFPGAATKVLLAPGALRSDLFPVALDLPPRRPGKIIILTVGRIHPRKGQLLTLQALNALPSRLITEIEYWIVGSSDKSRYGQTLREAAVDSDVMVRLLGNQSDEALDRIYAQADIFALTSIDHGHSVEGFGLVYLEAAAHGLPVVAHRVGGVAEAVADQETGFLVDPNQPSALTQVFQTLIEDAPLRHRMGKAGRAWARRTTWSSSAELLFQPAVTR